MRSFIKKYPLLVFILALAFVVRFAAGYIQSFSNDELSALYRLQYKNFYDLMYWGVQVDNHPAFTQLFLYLYEPLVPKGEIFIRLPFIIATTVSLGYVFFSLKKLSGEFAAYMVTIVLAFAGFSIQLGYFARPYAFGILFTSAATYYWIKIFIDQDKSKKYLIFFTLCAILSAYTHYLALLQIAILGIATFFFAPVRSWWKIVVAGMVSVLGFLPHFTITKYHLSVGGIGAWLGKAHDYFIVDIFFEYFDRSPFVMGAFLLVCLIVICLKPTQPKFKNVLVLAFISVTPFLILYFYSVKINPLLQYSACFFLMPFLLGTFFSIFETDLTNSKFVKYLYAGVVAVFMSSTLFFYSAFEPIHFAEFKKIAQYIEEHESDSVNTVVVVNNPFYIDYYLDEKKPDLYIGDMGDNLNFLRRYIDTCRAPEFVYAFTNERSNPEIPFLIQNSFPKIEYLQYFMNSELYHFSKKRTESVYYIPKYEFDYDGEKYRDVTGKKDRWYKSAFFIDSTEEFSPAFEIKLSELDLNPSSQVGVYCGVAEHEFCDMQIVISVETKGKEPFWKSRSLSNQYYHFNGGGRINMFFLSEPLGSDKIDLKNGLLKIYIWNPNGCKGIIGPFEIDFFEGNPFTTGYSQ